MIVSNQLVSFGEETDRRDARAILDMHRALASVRSTHRAFAGRTARESIQKIWQEPRMPRPRFAHNKPLDYPWTTASRDAFFAGTRGGFLVLEHATPVSHMTDSIFNRVSAQGFGVDEMLAFLREVHSELSFTVVTKNEDTRITAAGLRSELADGSSLWSRYETALGFGIDGFTSVTEDPRYIPRARREPSNG